MKLKIDENLPSECAEILRGGGFEADTVADERLTGAEDSAIAVRSRAEGRVLITLDLDFANIRAYPPEDYAGIIVHFGLDRNRKGPLLGVHFRDGFNVGADSRDPCRIASLAAHNRRALSAPTSRSSMAFRKPSKKLCWALREIVVGVARNHQSAICKSSTSRKCRSRVTRTSS